MNFADLNNLHAGRTAYIIGTGPSLDEFDFDSIDVFDQGFLIAIHRAIGIIPQNLYARTYWQVLDDAWTMGTPGPWHRWRDQLTAGNGVTGLFRDPLYMPKQPWTPAPVHPAIARFGSPRKGDKTILTDGREEIARRGDLYTYAGSGCTAIHAAWYMGAKRSVLVGLDGSDGHAVCLDQWYDSPVRGGLGYVPARDCMLEAASKLGLTIVDTSKELVA